MIRWKAPRYQCWGEDEAPCSGKLAIVSFQRDGFTDSGVQGKLRCLDCGRDYVIYSSSCEQASGPEDPPLPKWMPDAKSPEQVAAMTEQPASLVDRDGPWCDECGWTLPDHDDTCLLNTRKPPTAQEVVEAVVEMSGAVVAPYGDDCEAHEASDPDPNGARFAPTLEAAAKVRADIDAFQAKRRERYQNGKLWLPPPFRWAGGKRSSLPRLMPLALRWLERAADRVNNTTPAVYYEPFVGGGALFWALAGKDRDLDGWPWGTGSTVDGVHFPETDDDGEPLDYWAVIGDTNPDLIRCYRGIRDDVESVIRFLEDAKLRHNDDPEAYYLAVRAMEVPTTEPGANYDPLCAARFLYLVSVGFNGVWRTNSEGKHNVPLGRKSKGEGPDGKKPPLMVAIDHEHLRTCALALRGVRIVHGDFRETLKTARTGDLVYLDSPYAPVGETADFGERAGSYGNAAGFSTEDQAALAATARRLADAGITVIASNADTPEIRALYARRGTSAPFTFETLAVPRAINSKADKRGPVSELLLYANIAADAVEWRPVPGWPYEASSAGRVRHVDSLEPLAGKIDKYGYRKIILCDGTERRWDTSNAIVVCTAWHGPKPEAAEVVRHLNGNPADDAPSNLTWGTQQENMADKYAHGTAQFGENSTNAKLTEAQVQAILADEQSTAKSLAKLYGVSKQTIYAIRSQRNWSYLHRGKVPATDAPTPRKKKEAAVPTEPRPYIVRVTSTLKSGDGQPWTVQLAQHTLLQGPRGSGKSRVQQAIQWFFTGRLEDVAQRDPKAVGELRSLAWAPEGDGGEQSSFYVEVEWSDGVAHRRALGEDAKENLRILPMSELLAALRSGPDVARSFFLERLQAGITEADVAQQIGEANRERYNQIADNISNPVVRLLTVIQYCKDRAREIQKEAKDAEALLATAPVMPPSQARVAELRAQSDSYEQQRKAHVYGRVKTARQDVIAWQGLLPQFPEAPAFDPEQQKRDDEFIQRLESFRHVFGVCIGKQLDSCPVCEIHPGSPIPLEHWQAQFDKFQALVVKEQQAQHERMTAEPKITVPLAGGPREMTRGEVQANLNMAVTAYRQATQGVGEISDEKLAALGTPTLPYADIVQLQAKLSEDIGKEQHALNRWADVLRARETQASAEQRKASWTSLQGLCEQARDTLLRMQVQQLTHAVNRYLPKALANPGFALWLGDAKRETCRVGLYRKIGVAGVTIHTALSGAEEAAVLLALAAALAERTTTPAILIPRERAFDPKALRETMRALTKSDCQIILTSTVAPAGRGSKDWSVIETVPLWESATPEEESDTELTPSNGGPVVATGPTGEAK